MSDFNLPPGVTTDDIDPPDQCEECGKPLQHGICYWCETADEESDKE